MSDYQPPDKKIVAVANEKFDVGKVLNALGHTAIGFGAGEMDSEKLNLLTYVDADGNQYPNISHYPFIVLKARPNQVKMFAQACNEQNISHASFTETMYDGGSEMELARTKETSYEDLTFVVVVAFGDRNEIDPLTKKFSLWR